MPVELKGKLNGLAIRVPLLNGSLTDCVFEVQRETSVEEVNSLLKVRGMRRCLRLYSAPTAWPVSVVCVCLVLRSGLAVRYRAGRSC